MRINPKKARERVPNHRASKKYFSFRWRDIFRRPSTFLLPSASTNSTLSLSEGRSYLTGIFVLPAWVPNIVWEFTKLTQTKNQEKFFVKNDHTQYGKEFLMRFYISVFFSTFHYHNYHKSAEKRNCNYQVFHLYAQMRSIRMCIKGQNRANILVNGAKDGDLVWSYHDCNVSQ